MAGMSILQIAGILFFFVASFIYTKKNDKSLSDFKSKINNRNFTKRIVVYDFLKKRMNENWYTVGIWLDYPKQLMALRLDRNSTGLIDIPFNKIQGVEIIEDGYSITTGGGVGVGPVIIGGAKSSGISKGLQVRIVTGGINGTHPYILKLWEPSFGAKVNKSDPLYKAIQECARSIVDECNNIMIHSGQY